MFLLGEVGSYFLEYVAETADKWKEREEIRLT